MSVTTVKLNDNIFNEIEENDNYEDANTARDENLNENPQQVEMKSTKMSQSATSTPSKPSKDLRRRKQRQRSVRYVYSLLYLFVSI
jgi:hypothetical protein